MMHPGWLFACFVVLLVGGITTMILYPEYASILTGYYP